MENSILFTYKLDGGNIVFSFPTTKQYEPTLENMLKSIPFEQKKDKEPYEKITYSARIILHKKDDIEKVEHYMFGQETLLSDDMVPIIHISENSIDELTNIFRYASIVDSSIWNYFIQIDNSESDISRLKDILNKITSNYNDTLYQTTEAKEYAELHARLTQQAYIGTLNNASISPFVFHSETGIENFMLEEKEKKRLDEIRNAKWRLLLIADDNEFLRNIIKKRIVQLFNEKTAVELRDVTVPDFYHHQETSKTSIRIDYVNDCKRGIEALNERKYDIILLDYLITNKNGRSIFSYDILKQNNYEKIKVNMRGPNNKFFFFFFSPFTSAVFERLSAEKIDSIDNDKGWQISVGACPFNTPQLFSYNLIRFMYRRLIDTGIHELSQNNIYELLKNIYSDKQIRNAAGSNYPIILNMQYTYRRLLNDVNFPNNAKDVFDTCESVLVSDFISKRVNLGGMLEHLAQLVHLTAFGTVRQWPEMWEEFIYFRSQFDKHNNADFDNKGVSDEELNELYFNIEKHIIQLKSHQ